MAKTKLEAHLSVKELEKRMKKSKSKEQYKKYHVIYLIQKKKLQSQEVAETLCIPVQTVYKWVYLYNKYGETALILKGRGGRRNALMSFEEEEKLLEKLQEKAVAGLIVIARTIKAEVEKKLKRKVCKNYGYDILHRHGWRKVVPRPKHPKGDPEIQELFKKNFRRWLPQHLRPLIQKIKDR